jgi:hypothetical protein
MSESPKLRRDVDFWLNPSAGNANLVITLKMKQTGCSHNRNLRHRSRRVQNVSVAKTSGKVTVSAPLRIPFLAFFDRQPSPAEKDVITSKERLQNIAEDIWEEQEI